MNSLKVRLALTAITVATICPACGPDPVSMELSLADRVEVLSSGETLVAGQLAFSGALQKLSLDSLQLLLTVENKGAKTTTQLSPCFSASVHVDSLSTSAIAFRSEKVRFCPGLAAPITFEPNQIERFAFAFRAADMTTNGVTPGRYYFYIEPLTEAPLPRRKLFAGSALIK